MTGRAAGSGGSPPRAPGRRGGGKGSIEPREDRISAYWTLGVTGLFALVLLLSLAGVPSRFLTGPTAPPLPSVPVPSVSIPASPSIEVIPPVSPSVAPQVSPAP